MKDLSHLDMKDLAKDWESSMNPSNLYTFLSSKVLHSDLQETDRLKLKPRPRWKAPI